MRRYLAFAPTAGYEAHILVDQKYANNACLAKVYKFFGSHFLKKSMRSSKNCKKAKRKFAEFSFLAFVGRFCPRFLATIEVEGTKDGPRSRLDF